jgi:tetratricopeptide (TPR) repeat protein
MFSDLLQSGRSANKNERYWEGLGFLRQARHAPEYEQCPAADKFEINLELAKALRYTGEIEEARRYLDEAFCFVRKSDSFDYSCVEKEQGMLFYAQHDMARARESLGNALRIRQNLLSDYHESIAEVLSSLGDVESRDGEDQKAVQYYDRAMEMRIGLGEQHRDYLESLTNKAGTLLKAGKLDEAEAMLKKTIAMQETHLGPEHPLVAMSLNNLSVVLLSKGVVGPLEELINRALGIMEKAYGPDSTYTAVPISNFGHYEQKKGNFKEAAKYFAHALAIKEKALGLSNPGLIIPLKSLWYTYTKLERTAEADELQARLETVMLSQIALSGEKNIIAMSLFSDYLFQQKRFQECDQWIDKTLAVARDQFGANSLKVAEILQFKGTTLMARDLDQAKECYIQALKIRKKELGKTHAQVAILLRLLAACFTRQNNGNTSNLLIWQARAIEFRHGLEDAALVARSRLLNQLRDTKGVHNAQVLQAMRNQAHTLLISGKQAEGKAAFWKYIDVLKEKNGGEDLTLVDEIIAGAFTLGHTGNTRDSLEAFQRALQIQENRLGTVHGELRGTIDSIFDCHLKLKDFEAAEEAIRRSLRITERMQEDKYEWLRSSLPKLKNILELQGKAEESKLVAERIAAVPEESEAEKTARVQAFSKALQGINESNPALAALFGIPVARAQQNNEQEGR